MSKEKIATSSRTDKTVPRLDKLVKTYL